LFYLGVINGNMDTHIQDLELDKLPNKPVDNPANFPTNTALNGSKNSSAITPTINVVTISNNNT